MRLVIFLAAIAATLLQAGCDKKTSCDCPAFPNGDTVAVSIKEKVTVYNCCNDRFSLTFSNVKEDSRCPDGFNCLVMNPIWQGTARVVLKINTVQTVELEINKPTVVNTTGHVYTLLLNDLTPHPKSGLPTDPNSYEAKIIVNRN